MNRTISPHLVPMPLARDRLARLSASLALIAILLLGFALRTHQVEQRSLWEDEGWTMLLSAGPGLDDVVHTMIDDQHPPLFFVAFRLWRDVAGDTEFAGRFFSVLISLVAVAGCYQLGRTLFGAKAGLWSALLLALADLPIDLAQEIRHYSLLSALTIVSSMYYMRWWRTPARSARIGYVMSSMALLYTHYLGGFVLATQVIHVVITFRGGARLREAFFLFGAACAGFLPWIPVVVNQNLVRWDNPLYYQNALPNSRETFTAVSTAVVGHSPALLGLLIVLGMVAVMQRASQQLDLVHASPIRPYWATSVLYLVLWIALMVGTTVLINAHSQFLTVRNFVIVVPPLLLLAGHGLSRLPRVTRGFMVVLILIISLTTVDARRHYPDWRRISHTLSAYHLAQEPVLMDVWVGDFPLRYYLARDLGQTASPISLREWRAVYKGQFLTHVLDLLQKNNSFWLVSWNDSGLDDYGSLVDNAGFQRTATLLYDHLGTPIYSYRYDHLPEETLAVFGDLMTLERASAPAQARPGQPLSVTLWWSARQPIPVDYSISVVVLDRDGQLIAQHDGPPLNGLAPSSRWQIDQPVFDQHTLSLPADLAPGDYTLGVRVYWYGDMEPLPVKSTAQDTIFTLGTLTIIR